MALERNPTSSHSTETSSKAARSRVEDGLPAYGKLWGRSFRRRETALHRAGKKQVASYND